MNGRGAGLSLLCGVCGLLCIPCVNAETGRTMPSGVVMLDAPQVIDPAHPTLPVIGVVQDVPLPIGIGELQEPVKVRAGTTMVRVQGFFVPSDDAKLVEFYNQALPLFGWRLSPLPWQEHQAEAQQRLEQFLQDHPDLSADAQRPIREALTAYRDTSESLRRQIYAVQGREHLIVNLWTVKGGALVFLNRWTGNEGFWAVWTTASGQVPVNATCAVDSTLPGAGGSPVRVPSYPGAKPFAQQASSEETQSLTLLVTDDDLERVMAFYRAEMPKAGWRLVGESVGPDSASITPGRRLMIYETAGYLCSLEAWQASSGSGKARTTVSVDLRPAPER